MYALYLQSTYFSLNFLPFLNEFHNQILDASALPVSGKSDADGTGSKR
jgi:hypothetical protein